SRQRTDGPLRSAVAPLGAAGVAVRVQPAPAPGAVHDRVEVVIARPPAQLRPGQLRGGNQRRRVARAAWLLVDRDLDPGDALYRGDHLAVRIAFAVAEVEAAGAL